jgi:hypothetical protein
MSTARDRFGVSILVGFVVAVLLSFTSPLNGAGRDPLGMPLVSASADEGLLSIESVMTAASSRVQLAIALGAGVPMLIVGFMVRRRILADL